MNVHAAPHMTFDTVAVLGIRVSDLAAAVLST
jgi:hypothetical protein